MPDTRLEFCVEMIPVSYAGDAPCGRQPFRKGTETNAAGKFSVIDLPVGYYVITIEVDDVWTVFGVMVSSRVLVEEGRKTDIGEIQVEVD